VRLWIDFGVRNDLRSGVGGIVQARQEQLFTGRNQLY
jgi:hypothetical protein